MPGRPLLLVDVDGVIALFNLTPTPPAGRWQLIEGFPYYLKDAAAELLGELATAFELAWCTGWEERANDHLPRLIGVGPLPVLSFDRNPGRANAHWKLAAIDAHAGTRPLAWIDDALDERCHAWAAERRASGAATLLVTTQPHEGLGREHADALLRFAAGLGGAA